jgi:hypothetical protein
MTLTACDWDMFKMDNYEYPNATLQGGIRDEVTNDLVETDIQNGSRLVIQELGRPTGTLTRVVKQNGEYCDKLFFSGSYSIDFNTCNFYPFMIEKLDVKKGVNNVDFKVTPYIRVKNVNIRQEGNLIIATFKLQAGKEEVRLSNIRLYAHTDIYVGDQYTDYTPGGSGFQQSFSPVAVIDENTEYTLTIDLTNDINKNYFRYPTKNYYFRVGAIASVSGVGTIRRNYAPHTVLTINAPK